MKYKSTIKQITYILVFCILSLTVISSLCKKNKAPDKPTTPTGVTSTYNKAPETYTSSATDPDNNNVRLIFDWGDTNVDSAPEYVASGTSVSMDHGWANPGTYKVKVRAIDEKGLESEWSDTLSVTVAYNSPPTIDTIIGPGLSPYLMSPSSTRYIRFSTIARDSTDSVYVKFMSKKKSAASYTLRSWIGPKVSGSTFRDSLTFTQQDTYIVRAIAKDTKNSQSETTNAFTVIVSGPLWTFNTPDENEFYSSPALTQINGEWLVFIGGIDGYFYIVSASNGVEKWHKKTVYDPEYPTEPEDVLYASPAVNAYFDPPHVYVGGEMGELYCYKANSSSLWEWRYPDSSYDALTYNEISNSVTFKDNRVYVGINCGYANDYRLYALQDNGSTCSVAWSFPTGCDIVSSPVIDASENIYFGDDSGYVTRLAFNGAENWRIRIGTGVYSIYSSIAIATDGIYIGTDDGFLYKLNAATGATIWKYPSSGSGLDGVRSSPVIGTDGAIYFGCDDGMLYAVTATGQLKSGFPVTLSDDAITSTPAIAQDGSIIMYTDEDLVYSINPNGTIMWRVPLPGYSKSKMHHTPKLTKYHSKLEDILPSPTIGPNGTIYVGSVWQGLYAIKGTTSNALASTSWPKFRHDLLNSGKYIP
jgi:outer membrane protein assembly factor BamB